MTADLRYVRRYSSKGGGNAAFMRFERVSDGRIVEVRVRDADSPVDRYTRREARLVAEDQLAGSPAVWSVVCDEYATDLYTLETAMRLVKQITKEAACRFPHVLRNVDSCEVIVY